MSRKLAVVNKHLDSLIGEMFETLIECQDTRRLATKK